MTCWEKYIADHPHIPRCIDGLKCLPPGCPSNYGYLDDPSWCDGDGAECRMCWEREIPGTENDKKENENMSDELIAEAYDEKYKNTSASSHMYDNAPCGLNYEAEYERLKELVNQKDEALLENMNYIEMIKDKNNHLYRDVEKYRFGFRVVEAFLGTKILED